MIPKLTTKEHALQARRASTVETRNHGRCVSVASVKQITN